MVEEHKHCKECGRVVNNPYPNPSIGYIANNNIIIPEVVFKAWHKSLCLTCCKKLKNEN